MERDPAKRFQTADELHRAFCDIHKLDSRWKRQNAAKNAAAVALAGLFVLSGVSAAYGFKRMGEEKIAAYNEWVYEIPQADDDEPYNKAAALFPDKLDAYAAQALKLCAPGAYGACVEYVAGLMPRLTAYTWSNEDLLKIGDIFYIEGNAWFETENYPKAVASYEAAVTNNPMNPEMFRDYAIALARCGYVDRAEELLVKVEAMTIGVDSIDLLKGEIAYAKRDDAEAVSRFKNVINTSDSDYIRQRAYLICDRAYRRMPDMAAEETALLRAALNDLPDNYKIAVKERLADALVRAGENAGSPDAYYNEAIALFGEIKARGNQSYATAQNIGLLYQRMCDFAAARAAYTELAAAYPDDHRPYMRLAYLALEEQAALENDDRDYREAAEWYEQSRALYDRRPNGAGDDMEMLTMISLMDELRENGWF
jgi:serine/threonine-protein kinase